MIELLLIAQIATGDHYCYRNDGGGVMTRDEIASEQVDITIGNYGYLDDEPVTVMAAVATYAPEYLCPEFAR